MAFGSFISQSRPDSHLLFSYFNAHLWIESLPGHLTMNPEEVQKIGNELGEPSVFLDGIFDTEANPVLIPFADDPYPWDKTKWYCWQCLETLINSRLLSWLIAKRHKGPYIFDIRQRCEIEC